MELARAFDTTSLSDGEHTVTAALEATSGGVEVVHARFMVANDAAAVMFQPSSVAVAALVDDGPLTQQVTVNAAGPA